jgi:hypothetical protein
MGQAADLMHRKIAAFSAHDAKEFEAFLSPDIEWAIFRRPASRTRSGGRIQLCVLGGISRR